MRKKSRYGLSSEVKSVVCRAIKNHTSVRHSQESCGLFEFGRLECGAWRLCRFFWRPPVAGGPRSPEGLLPPPPPSSALCSHSHKHQQPPTLFMAGVGTADTGQGFGILFTFTCRFFVRLEGTGYTDVLLEEPALYPSYGICNSKFNNNSRGRVGRKLTKFNHKRIS